ncbi:MAG: sigma-70 family RNA polymerase sigma factor [Eubacteriales bacterium]
MEQYGSKQTYELIEKAQSGDEKAKNKLAEDNMGLVYSVARRFYGRGYDDEDLNQVGAIGLLKAIDKFDISFNLRFSTYAVPLIMGEIKRFLRDDGPVKVSRTIKHTAAEAARVIEEVQQKEGRVPGVLEIAQALGVPPEEVVQAREASVPPESFCCPRMETKPWQLLPSKENESDLLDRLDLKSAVADLPQREQTIIIMRYFLEKTQSDVAKKLGISQVQVSRLEKKILNGFRNRLKCKM